MGAFYRVIKFPRWRLWEWELTPPFRVSAKRENSYGNITYITF